jgi:hypothetical protein
MFYSIRYKLNNKFLSRLIFLALLSFLNGVVLAEEYEGPTISPEDLPNYQFENQPEEQEIKVEELSLGQQFSMSSQRGEITDLVTRHLGITSLAGNLEDIVIFQKLVDKEVIKLNDVKTWQALGIALGDLLANEFDLHWVVMEDEFGSSRALQWKDTLNFVFPVTLLSKRVQFGEAIVLDDIVEKLRLEIEAFKAYEKSRTRMNLPGSQRLDSDL